MDIKRVILDIINSDNNNVRYSYMAIEKLVMVMLDDYISGKSKEFISNYTNERRGFEFDGYAPDGFDGFEGSTAIELKIFRSNRIPKMILYNTIKRISLNGPKINNLLFIVIGSDKSIEPTWITEIQVECNFNLYIWDIDDLIKIFECNKDLFEKTYFNLNTLFFKDTISKSIKRDESTYKDNQKKYIDQLNLEYKKDNLVLFLGSGASRDAKIATWDTLISELFVALIDKELNTLGIEIEKADKNHIVQEVLAQNGNSPLLQTRFLRNGFAEEFQKVISEVLYKDSIQKSALLEEIGQLCIPYRGKIGIQAIVNYNFDDLVEKNLQRLRVKYFSIYAEGMVSNNEEIGIYHVHGFLPRNKDEYENIAKSLLVFSEEGYHKLLLEPYHWSNISQLNFLVNNTCLFIGLSMTDPNLRRLLEIAAQKTPDGDNTCRHYAIMRRFRIKGNTESIGSFEKANEGLQESFYKELGINVLWIDDYTEIPSILKSIKQ